MSVTTSVNQVEHHCPVENCLYSNGSERFFANKRLLNQHITKVHAEKKHICSKCQKGFGTDWLRKNHEVCCGKTWTCSCGVKYSSRESLWSHAKRKDHPTDELMLTPKQILSMNMKKLVSQPVVFVIQPIIQQQVSFVVPALPSDKRVILPKQSLPTLTAPTEIPYQSVGIKPDKVHTPSSTGKASRALHSERSKLLKSDRKQKSRLKAAAETQTCEELRSAGSTNQNPRKLESRGSQCSGRVKKQRVVIESTHTQTTESAVVRMMKKNPSTRSRRKSVAVVTEWENLQPTKALWSNIEEFIFPSAKDCEKVKSCSTQTSPSPYVEPAKVMCDSQTATDDSMFSFPSSVAMDHNLAFQASGCTSEKLLDPNPILNDKILTDSIMCEKDASLKPFQSFDTENKSIETNFCESTSVSSIPSLAMVANSYSNNANNTAEIGGFAVEKPACDGTQFSSGNKIEDELADLDSVLNTIISNSSNFQGMDSPLLSHTHTQTNLPLDIYYTSILANMETQTTDDFLFSDLEFSDTETQTPWEDISNIDPEVSSNQLSIEIQTDFSEASSSSSRNNELRIPLPSSGKHMETQTLDIYQMPQLTNSEAQTLTATSYLFT